MSIESPAANDTETITRDSRGGHTEKRITSLGRSLEKRITSLGRSLVPDAFPVPTIARSR